MPAWLTDPVVLAAIIGAVSAGSAHMVPGAWRWLAGRQRMGMKELATELQAGRQIREELRSELRQLREAYGRLEAKHSDCERRADDCARRVTKLERENDELARRVEDLAERLAGS